MTDDKVLVFLNPDTKEEINTINIRTNQVSSTVSLLLKNTGKVAVRDLILHSLTDLKLVKPEKLPDTIQAGEQVKLVFHVNTDADRQIQLSVGFTYIETVFT